MIEVDAVQLIAGILGGVAVIIGACGVLLARVLRVITKRTEQLAPNSGSSLVDKVSKQNVLMREQVARIDELERARARDSEMVWQALADLGTQVVNMATVVASTKKGKR